MWGSTYISSHNNPNRKERVEHCCNFIMSLYTLQCFPLKLAIFVVVCTLVETIADFLKKKRSFCKMNWRTRELV